MKEHIFFYDKDGNSCGPDTAVRFYRINLDDNDNMVSESMGDITQGSNLSEIADFLQKLNYNCKNEEKDPSVIKILPTKKDIDEYLSEVAEFMSRNDV